MKKPSTIFWALALALALVGFAPLGWAQDATMNDTESGATTEGDATAVAFGFAVSGEVPQFLLNLINSNPYVQIDMVDGVASGQISYVQAPATGMGEGSGSAWTGGTTYASRTLEDGTVVSSGTDGGTSAQASGEPIYIICEQTSSDTAYALGVLVAGGANFNFTAANHPVAAGAAGALSGSATSTRLGEAQASSFGGAYALRALPGSDVPDVASIENTSTFAQSFSTTPETYAAGAGFVAAAVLNGLVFEETGFGAAFSGVNSLGVVKTRFFDYGYEDDDDDAFNPNLGGFAASASGEAMASFLSSTNAFYFTQSLGETEAGAVMEVDPDFRVPLPPTGDDDDDSSPAGFYILNLDDDDDFTIPPAFVSGEIWAHAGKNALAVGFSGMEIPDHPIIPRLGATLALVDAVVYAKDNGAGTVNSAFQARGYAAFYNPPLDPGDDDDDNGGWTDYDPLAVITRDGNIISSAAIGAGLDMPAEGRAALDWKIAVDEEGYSQTGIREALSGAVGLSASAAFAEPLPFQIEIGPTQLQGSIRELSTTDFAAFNYVKLPEFPMGLPDINMRSELSGLYGSAATAHTSTELWNAAAFSNLSTQPFAKNSGAMAELLSAFATGPGSFSFALSGPISLPEFGAGFGLSIGVLPGQEP